MSRFDYDADIDDVTDDDLARWREKVGKALGSQRGQDALRKVEQALLAMTDKRLADSWATDDGNVCVIGALAAQRLRRMGAEDFEIAVSMLPDLYDIEEIADYAARRLGMSRTLALKLQFVNDEELEASTPEERYAWMLAWVQTRLAQGRQQRAVAGAVTEPLVYEPV